MFVALERRGDAPAELLASLGEEPAFLAAVTAAELLHGVHRADTAMRRARREAWVSALLAAIPVVSFDLDVARVYARVWADLAARGEGIGAHDAMIAATSLATGMPVLTANVRHFGRVEGLRVVPWA